MRSRECLLELGVLLGVGSEVGEELLKFADFGRGESRAKQ
jgi:hypothetical protein